MTHSIRAAAVLAARSWGEKIRTKKGPRGAPILTDKRCARASVGITTTYSLPSLLLQGLGQLLAATGLRQYPTKAEFRTMHPRRTRVRQLSAGQYHRPTHVDLGLPSKILTAGFASGANPNPPRYPGDGNPGRCGWDPHATWSQSHLGKKEKRVSSDKLKQDKII